MKGVDKKILAILFRFLPDRIEQLYKSKKNKEELKIWLQTNKSIPIPHIVKQNIIKEYQGKFGINIFIETGTYMGDMVYAQRNNFSEIYSVELSEYLWKKAVTRFKRNRNIKIIQGDSGKVLNDIMLKISTPAIFWLDGHYSAGITAKGEKECPIFEELEAIFRSKINHILLIDDARCFNGTNDYPTIDSLSSYILSKRPNSKIVVDTDVIRVLLE